MNSPLEKGNLLEAAVHAIENRILQDSPNLSNSAFKIESKKVIYSAGVRHEIDIWVEVDAGDGYGSIFIFECKNWEDKVSKNEIIIFSEKIDAAAVQKGYFVAKSFTTDAVAQAAKQPRMQLLIAEDLPTDILTPYHFHYLILEHAKTELTFKDRENPPGEAPKRDPVNNLKLDGKDIHIRDAVAQWASQIWNERSAQFQSGLLPEGIYSLSANGELHFEPGRLSAEDHAVEVVLYQCEFTARVARPAIISYFSIEKRGRAIQLAPVKFGEDAVAKATFVSTQRLFSE